MATQATDLRRGNAIKLNGELVVVIEFAHVRPGKGPAYLQGKLRSVTTGAIREHRFRVSESVERVFTEQKKCLYSYRNGSNCVFMDESNFEEYQVPEEMTGEAIQYFAEGEVLELEFADGELIGVAYPEYVTRTITQTMHDVKAVKATNQVKPATIDTGVEISVPIFIKEGDQVKLQTSTGKYHERAKS